MKNCTAFFVWTGLFVAVLCSGCGGGVKLPSDLPKLHPTVITVIQDDKPLAGAMVAMENVDPEMEKWSCVALTDDAGKATVQTKGQYVGAPEGTYKVTVTKQEMDRGPSPYEGAPNAQTDPDEYNAWLSKNEARIAAAEARTPVTHDLVDPQFGTIAKTSLEVTITAGKNQHTLDVGKAMRIVNRERPR